MSASGTRPMPLAWAHSTKAVVPSPRSANEARTGLPSGSVASALRSSPSSVASSASMVPSPPSATGISTASTPPSRSPAAMAAATSRAE